MIYDTDTDSPTLCCQNLILDICLFLCFFVYNQLTITGQKTLPKPAAPVPQKDDQPAKSSSKPMLPKKPAEPVPVPQKDDQPAQSSSKPMLPKKPAETVHQKDDQPAIRSWKPLLSKKPAAHLPQKDDQPAIRSWKPLLSKKPAAHVPQKDDQPAKSSSKPILPKKPKPVSLASQLLIQHVHTNLIFLLKEQTHIPKFMMVDPALFPHIPAQY